MTNHELAAKHSLSPAQLEALAADIRASPGFTMLSFRKGLEAAVWRTAFPDKPLPSSALALTERAGAVVPSDWFYVARWPHEWQDVYYALLPDEAEAAALFIESQADAADC